MNDKIVKYVITVVSVIVPLLVAVLLFMPQFFKLGDNDFSFLPHLNAVINSSTAIALMMALVFVKQGKVKLHQYSMTVAMCLSVLFLLSYVLYHSQAESTHFGGEGSIKYFYYFILLTHIVLSAIVIPFVLFAFYYALQGNVQKHKKIVKFGYPIWLYVAITGVLVYWLISPYYAS